jgi:hypothetical protein
MQESRQTKSRANTGGEAPHRKGTGEYVERLDGTGT